MLITLFIIKSIFKNFEIKYKFQYLDEQPTITAKKQIKHGLFIVF